MLTRIRCYENRGQDIEQAHIVTVKFERGPQQPPVLTQCTEAEAVKLFHYVKKLTGWYIWWSASPAGIWNARRVTNG